MTQATLVDGLGQLHTRVYASVGALPTPFLGAMAIVDGGTGGQLFISLHDGSGTLAWIALADLYDVVQTIATPTNNEITSSDPTATGLSVNVSGPALTLVSPETDILAIQSGLTPTQVPFAVVRGTSTPGVALLETEPDGSTIVPFVNGSGEIVVRTYSSLPGASTDHLGAIIRILGGSGVEDKFYLCVLDATGTPIWTQFIGPAGAAGAAGVTPQLRESGGYIQVSYDGGVTWSNLVPLTDITGPTGPTGPAGSINFPPLPAPGDGPTSFWISVLSTGQYLPWLIPAGYEVQVIGSSGLWGAVQFGDSDFISDGLGNNDGATWPTPHDSRFATGRIVAQTFDSTGALYAPDGTHNFNDPWTVMTLEEDSYMAFLENVSTGNLAAQISVLVTVTPHATELIFDFTANDGGWTGFTADDGCGTPINLAHYVSGVGWEFPAYTPSCVGHTECQGQITKDLGATYAVSSMEVFGYYYGPGASARQIYSELGTTPAPFSGPVYINSTTFPGPAAFDIPGSGSSSGRYVELVAYDVVPGLADTDTVFLITKIIISI